MSHFPPITTAIALAIAQYNQDHPEMPTASMDAEVHFLFRITVNWLRHRHPAYESRLVNCTKYSKKYVEINREIYEEIGNRYPMLKWECERQLNCKIEQHKESPILRALAKQLEAKHKGDVR